MNSEYKILSTKECMAYIQQQKVDLKNNNWDYSIPSMKGIIYTLPNGEFVLLPSNLKESYPGIIFTNEKIFSKYVAEDSFPIGESNMTWFESHKSDIKLIGINNESIYKKIPEIQSAYNTLLQFVYEKKNDPKSKESAIYAFGISVINWLLTTEKFTVRLEKRYAMYNYYYYPLLVKDHKNYDLLTHLEISLDMKDSDSFNFFWKPYLSL